MNDDFKIENLGSLVAVTPITHEAFAWLEENVTGEDHLWYGGSLMVEPRYVDNLVDGMIESGLTVAA